MSVPSDLLYTKSHEWVRMENDAAVVGLTDYAQNALGDLVFINLPLAGDEITAGEQLADVESVKAVSDVFSPVSGTIETVNEDLLDHPEKINQAPYEAWIARIKPVTDRSALLTPKEYEDMIAKEG